MTRDLLDTFASLGLGVISVLLVQNLRTTSGLTATVVALAYLAILTEMFYG